LDLIVPGRERPKGDRVDAKSKQVRDQNMRSGCLWLLGVPIPIIILLWLITGHA
jgi:hypothetical protein